MVFKKNAIDSYISHLKSGYPAACWSDGAGETMDSLFEKEDPMLHEGKLKCARAEGLKKRYDRMLDLLEEEDSRSMSAKLNVLVRIEEIFHGEESVEINEQLTIKRQINREVYDT